MNYNYKSSNNIVFSTIRSLSPVLGKSIAPFGTYKMLHEASTDVSITKNGLRFLNSVQINSPVAKQIVKLLESVGHSSNDGTISILVFVAALIEHLEVYLAENIHPRVLYEGLGQARKFFLENIASFQLRLVDKDELDLTLLFKYCFSLLRSKLDQEISEKVSKLTFEAFLSLYGVTDTTKEKALINNAQFIYTRLIEIVEMPSCRAEDSTLVKGLVLDHGPRHPFAKLNFKNTYILLIDIGLEKEKTEVNSSFAFHEASQYEEMALAERAVVKKKIALILELNQAIKKIEETAELLLINYTGIDPTSLEELHDSGIEGIRRCKKRNLERISKICGGHVIRSKQVIKEALEKASGQSGVLEAFPFLGWAGKITVEKDGEDVYTYIEETKNPSSCTLVLKGPSKSKTSLLKESVEQTLMAMMKGINEGVVKGAGNFELRMFKLMQEKASSAPEGFNAFCKALLAVPKAIISTKGLSGTVEVEKLLANLSEDSFVDLDDNSHKVLDGFSTKKDVYSMGTIAVQNFMLIDQIIAPKIEPKQNN